MVLVWFQEQKLMFSERHYPTAICNGDSVCFLGGRNRILRHWLYEDQRVKITSIHAINYKQVIFTYDRNNGLLIARLIQILSSDRNATHSTFVLHQRTENDA